MFDHTHRGVLAFTYDLPFGHGQNRFDLGSRWINAMFGGWHLVNGIYTVSRPASPSPSWARARPRSATCTYFGAPLDYNPRQTNGPGLQRRRIYAARLPGHTASGLAFCIHGQPVLLSHPDLFELTFSSLRGDMTNQVNSSILKQRFEIREKMYLQLRFEVFNVLNHASFAFPRRGADQLRVRTDHRAVQSAEEHPGKGYSLRFLGISANWVVVR